MKVFFCFLPLSLYLTLQNTECTASVYLSVLVLSTSFYFPEDSLPMAWECCISLLVHHSLGSVHLLKGNKGINYRASLSADIMKSWAKG
jgi:hypothetical protein